MNMSYFLEILGDLLGIAELLFPCLITLIISQGIKVLLTGKIKSFTEDGGLSSSHCATCATLVIQLMLLEHTRQNLWIAFKSIGLFVYFIIARDAVGVRYFTGIALKTNIKIAKIYEKFIKQEKADNDDITILQKVQEECDQNSGHTKKEVIIGTCIGMIVAIVATAIRL